MTDTRTKAELARDHAALQAEHAAVLERLEEATSTDGKFEGDIAVQFSHNAGEQRYRVEMHEWRKGRQGWGWYPYHGFDTPFDDVKEFPARKYHKALDYYSRAVGWRARIRAAHWRAQDVEAGWTLVSGAVGR